jgi:pimeloyl-ACP methyl ester carboxylesterase
MTAKTFATAHSSIEAEIFGEGKPIVFLHGMPTDRRSLVARFEPVFASRPGWQRIYFNNPGIGASTLKPELKNLADYVATIGDAVEAAVPSGRFALFGASWGGEFALGLMKRFLPRVSGVGLLVPSMNWWQGAMPKPGPVHEEPGVFDGLPPPLAGAMKHILVVQTAKVRDTLMRDVISGGKAIDPRVNEVLGEASTGPDYATFDGPALILAGRQDSVCGYEGQFKLLEHLPHATYAVLDRAGHALAIEQEPLAQAFFAEWLDRMG